MGDVYEDIERCNPNKERKILIVFDDIIGDSLAIKKIIN